MSLLIAFILAVIGILPILFAKDNTLKLTTCIRIGLAYIAVGWWIVYACMPSIAYPIFGWFAGIVVVWLIISSAISFAMSDGEFNWSWLMPAILLLIIIISCFGGCTACRTEKYASLIGDVQNKNKIHWTQDAQPLDPTHIRLVPKELAISRAETALGENGSSLGSQFEISKQYTTLQKINNQYYYLIPLDYAGFSVWTKADFIPGYVKINACEPFAAPQLITNKKIIYTPEAFFGENLERKLWSNGYINKVLCDYSFEEDDNNNIY